MCKTVEAITPIDIGDHTSFFSCYVSIQTMHHGHTTAIPSKFQKLESLAMYARMHQQLATVVLDEKLPTCTYLSSTIKKYELHTVCISICMLLKNMNMLYELKLLFVFNCIVHVSCMYLYTVCICNATYCHQMMYTGMYMCTCSV